MNKLPSSRVFRLLAKELQRNFSPPVLAALAKKLSLFNLFNIRVNFVHKIYLHYILEWSKILRGTLLLDYVVY